MLASIQPGLTFPEVSNAFTLLFCGMIDPERAHLRESKEKATGAAEGVRSSDLTHHTHWCEYQSLERGGNTTRIGPQVGRSASTHVAAYVTPVTPCCASVRPRQASRTSAAKAAAVGADCRRLEVGPCGPFPQSIMAPYVGPRRAIARKGWAPRSVPPRPCRARMCGPSIHGDPIRGLILGVPTEVPSRDIS